MILNEKFLKQQYLVKELSSRIIGKKVNLSCTTILYWLHEYNIPVRFRKHTERTKKHFAIFAKKLHTGKVVSLKTRKLQSESAKTRFKNPQDHPNYKGGLIALICKECKKRFKIHNYRKDTAKYCSKRCLSKYMLKIYKGKNNPMYGIHRFGKDNPNYKGGLNKRGYSYKFNDKLKEQVRKRDNHICRKCGMKQKDYYRKLDVHHIDYDKDNLNLKNLISLCQNCHLITNGNRDYWFAYFCYHLRIEPENFINIKSGRQG